MQRSKIIFIAITVIIMMVWVIHNDHQISKVPSLASTQQQPSTIEIDTKVDQQVHRAQQPLLAVQKPQSPDYILDCSPLVTDTKTAAQTLKSHIASLQHSTRQKDQLAYALFTPPDDQQSAIDLLTHHLQQYPEDNMAIIDSIGWCAQPQLQQHKACNSELIEKILLSENNNGATWMLIANYYASKKDRAAVIASIEQANNSPYFNEYSYQSLELFMDVTADSMVDSFSQRAVVALGYNAARPAFNQELITFCFAQIKQQNNAADSCFQLAKNMANHGKTRMTQAIGLALQQQVFVSRNEQHQVAAIKTKINDLYQNTHLEQYNQAAYLALADSNFFYRWLQQLNEYGEGHSLHFLINEAKLLSQNRYYNPCP